jgi:hypothetical protein
MTRLAPIACAAAVLALLAGSAGAEASSTARAELRLVRTAPIVVAGAGFLPDERVTVRVAAKGERRARPATATRAGRFVVRFSSLVYSHCYAQFRIWAIGAQGSRAEVKTSRFQCPPPPPE